MLGFLPTCWRLFVRRHIFCQRQCTFGLYIIFNQILFLCRYFLSTGTLCLQIRFVCRYALSADSFCSRYDLVPIRFGPIRFVPTCFIPVCFVPIFFIPVCFVPVRLSTYLYIYVCVFNIFLSIVDPISCALSVSYLHICNIMKHIYWFLAMHGPPMSELCSTHAFSEAFWVRVIHSSWGPILGLCSSQLTSLCKSQML